MKKVKLANIMRFVISLFVCFSMLSATAQVANRMRTVNYNGYKILTTPDIFNKWLTRNAQSYYDDALLTVSVLNSSNNKPWCIYSDRNDNPLLNPAGGETNKRLGFLQPLYVSDVFQSSLLKVCGYEKDANGTPIFKELGFISRERVLLSSFSCLNSYGASRHAMICYSLDSDVKNKKDIVDYLGDKNRFFLRPDFKYDQGVPKKFKIYFVLKEEGNMLLLSTKDQISASDYIDRGSVPGWINKILVTQWDHKVCLQPNFGTKVKAYESFQSRVPTFYEIQSARLVDKTGELGASEEQDVAAYWPLASLPGNHFRLPVLEEVTKGDDRRLRTVASLVGAKKEINIDDGQTEKILKDLEKKIKRVNILIVLDGSRSMEEYFTGVANSLQAITQNMRAGGFEEVKIGVAIYRDAADAAYPSLISATSKFHRDYEFLPLTNNIELVESFLKESAATYQNINSVGSDRYESMNSGLYRAIQDANFNPNESNFMLLAGDCGNHPTDNSISLNQIVDIIANKNLNVQAYQVHYGERTSDETSRGLMNPYLKFKTDLSYVIKESTKKRLEIYNRRSSNNQSVIEPITFKFDINQSQNFQEIRTYKNAQAQGDVLVSNRMTWTEQVINSSMFTSNTTKSINRYFESLNVQIRTLQSSANSTKRNPSNPTDISVDLDDLCRMRGLTDEQCEAIKNYGNFSIIGYTLTEFYGTGTKAYSTVVFMTVQEKQNLANKLSNVVQKSSAGSERRSSFKIAIIDLVKGIMGDNDNVVIEQLTLAEIWEKCIGVKFNQEYQEIGNIPIGLLDQSSVVSDGDFEVFFSNFKNKVIEFSNFRDSNLQGEIGEQMVMWVPTKVFPLCDNE